MYQKLTTRMEGITPTDMSNELCSTIGHLASGAYHAKAVRLKRTPGRSDGERRAPRLDRVSQKMCPLSLPRAGLFTARPRPRGAQSQTHGMSLSRDFRRGHGA